MSGLLPLLRRPDNSLAVPLAWELDRAQACPHLLFDLSACRHLHDDVACRPAALPVLARLQLLLRLAIAFALFSGGALCARSGFFVCMGCLLATGIGHFVLFGSATLA